MKISSDYPFNNRAAIYGDGCFTTAAMVNGKVELLEYHLNRLGHACSELHLPMPQSHIDLLRKHMQNAANNNTNGVLKVLLSAGSGGRGYQRNPSSDTEAFIQLLEPVSHYSVWRKNGVTLSISSEKLSINQCLAGIKHLNRLEQVLLREQQLAGEDALVCDTQDIIVESFAGNVFWYALGRWFTPDLSLTGVSGVMRNYILDSLTQSGTQVSIVRATPAALSVATEVFICNSLMKVVPVKQIMDTQGKELASFSQHNQTNALIKLISHRVNCEQ